MLGPFTKKERTGPAEIYGFSFLFYFGNIPQHEGEKVDIAFLDSGHRLHLPENGSQISPADLGLE